MEPATEETTPIMESTASALQEQITTLQQMVTRLSARAITEKEIRSQHAIALTQQREADHEALRQLTESVSRLVDRLDLSQRSEPVTPTPAPCATSTPAPRDDWRDTYATPTGVRVQTGNHPRLAGANEEQEDIEDTIGSWTKILKYLFPKMDTKDIDLFFVEAEFWFRNHGVRHHSRMIAYTSQYLEGSARDWWKSKLRVDCEQEGILFHDWTHFTTRLKEQYSQKDTQVEAFNEIQRLRMPNDYPGTATKYVERFRDLNSRANVKDPMLSIHLFRSGLTRNILEKFERDPPKGLWGWYQEVEAIDQQRGVNQQAARFETAKRAMPWRSNNQMTMVTPPRNQQAGNQAPVARKPEATRPLPPHLAQRLPPRQSQGPSAMGNDTCHICKRPGHWANNCPEKTTHAVVRPAGPRVGVNVIASDQEADYEAEGSEYDPQEDEGLDLEAVLHEEGDQGQGQGNEDGTRH